jgi:hypothetical protein
VRQAATPPPPRPPPPRTLSHPPAAATLCATLCTYSRQVSPSLSRACSFRTRSGGKRGATIISGQSVSILRRYGNVVRHDSPPVRYVEYSVVVPTAASVANQPDGGAAAIAAARALGAGSSGSGSRLGGGVGRGGGGGGGAAAIAAGALSSNLGLEYRLYHTQHRECSCGAKDCQGACKTKGEVASPSTTMRKLGGSSGSSRKRKLSDMAGKQMSASQSLMVDAALMSLAQPEINMHAPPQQPQQPPQQQQLPPQSLARGPPEPGPAGYLPHETVV